MRSPVKSGKTPIPHYLLTLLKQELKIITTVCRHYKKELTNGVNSFTVVNLNRRKISGTIFSERTLILSYNLERPSNLLEGQEAL